MAPGHHNEKDAAMTAQDPTPPMPPNGPMGRFKRLWSELEVEVVDEMALRSFDLHPTGDGEGNMTGLIDMDINQRTSFAVNRIIMEALQAAEEQIGIRWLSGGYGVRPVDDANMYTKITLDAMPNRNDDGSYGGELG